MLKRDMRFSHKYHTALHYKYVDMFVLLECPGFLPIVCSFFVIFLIAYSKKAMLGFVVVEGFRYGSPPVETRDREVEM